MDPWPYCSRIRGGALNDNSHVHSMDIHIHCTKVHLCVRITLTLSLTLNISLSMFFCMAYQGVCAGLDISFSSGDPWKILASQARPRREKRLIRPLSTTLLVGSILKVHNLSPSPIWALALIYSWEQGKSRHTLEHNFHPSRHLKIAQNGVTRERHQHDYPVTTTTTTTTIMTTNKEN